VTVCPLCNEWFKKIEVKTNFSLLGYLEEKKGMSTICTFSNEPENYYCLDCKEIVCDACAYSLHKEHPMIKPTLKTLSLRKEILELAGQHEAKKEFASNEELTDWKEEWIQKIKQMQTWETNFIQGKKKELIKGLEDAVKIYTGLIQVATDLLLQKLDTICPPPNPPGFKEKMEKEKLELLLLFEKNNYKEDKIANQICKYYLNRYKIKSQDSSLTLSERINIRYRIGDALPNKPEKSQDSLDYLFTTFLPELVTEGNSQYSSGRLKICQLVQSFLKGFKLFKEDKGIKELLDEWDFDL